MRGDEAPGRIVIPEGGLLGSMDELVPAGHAIGFELALLLIGHTGARSAS